MTNQEQSAVRSLVICYAAYLEALNDEDFTRMAHWARALLAAQRGSGVTMIDPIGLLYPLTGDGAAVQRAVSNDRWVEAMASELTEADGSKAQRESDRIAASCGRPAYRLLDEGDSPGGALVPAPKPPPRKPSPSAANDLGARAAAFFGK